MQGVGNHDPDGADNDIRMTAADDYGIFSGSSVCRTGFEHDRCGNGICADGMNFQFRESFPDGSYELFSGTAAEGIYDQYVPIL